MIGDNSQKRLRKYFLKEMGVAAQSMADNKSAIHAFDLGRTTEGVELAVLISIVPRETADAVLEAYRNSFPKPEPTT